MKNKLLTIAFTIAITALISIGGTYLFINDEPRIEYVTQTEYIERNNANAAQENILRPFLFTVEESSIVRNNGDLFEVITLEDFENQISDTEDDRSFHLRLYLNPEAMSNEDFSKTIMCADSSTIQNPIENGLITFDSGINAYFTQEFCDFHYVDRYVYSGEGYGKEYFIVFSANYLTKDSSMRDKARTFAKSIQTTY